MDATSWSFTDTLLPIAFLAFVFYLVRKLWAAPAPVRMADLTPKPPPVVRPFSRSELRPFDGSNGQPLYIAARGRVFDVSSKPSFYGPGSAYHVFTGRDASRAFALHSTELVDVENYRIDDLNASQLSALDDWVSFISARYPEIGFLVEDGALPAAPAPSSAPIPDPSQ